MTVVKYIPVGLLVALIGKMLVVGNVSFAEMGVALGIIGYVALRDYVEKHLTIQEGVAKFESEAKEMKDIISKQNEVIVKMATEIDAIKTSIVGVKMGVNFSNKKVG